MMRSAHLFIALALLPATLPAREHLDHNAMRLDLFAMISGDKAAEQRLLALTAGAIEKDPDHAQALAWHGATLIASSMRDSANPSGDPQSSRQRFSQGITETDRAVMLTPDDVEIRSVRGVLMQLLSRNMPGAYAGRMLDRARDDYQRIFDLQAGVLERIGPHPSGELLQALGDIYARRGQPEEAEKYYRMIDSKLPGTEYARRAAQWLATRQPLSAEQTACIGCHIPAPQKR
jgi:tetratricopeptide (TPR) repeat protein